MENVSKSSPIVWTGMQQNTRVKHRDQTSLYWIRMLNYEMFLQVQQLHTKMIIYGLVYTEIQKTMKSGFGLVGYKLLSILGVICNRTVNREARIVGY